MVTREKRPVLALATLALVLLLASSLIGIFADDGGQPYRFTSLRKESIAIYGGQGLYQYDSVAKATAFRGFDWANLAVCVPALVVGMRLYGRGRLRGQLLLGAIFTYLAYIYLIGVMGNAFNGQFLIWTALFSTGLFGLILLLVSMDMAALPGKLEHGFSRKIFATYLIGLGLLLPFPYLAEIMTAYVTGSPPGVLEIYTTLELAALELGVMVPLHLGGGVLLWKGKAWGYVLAGLLPFAASMTFIALSVGQLLLYRSYQQGSPAEVLQVVLFAVIASGFSLAIFKQVRA
jgi:hypothetical protein